MCSPGLPNLRLHVRESRARWGIRNPDQMVAGWTLNLPPGELRLALERLIAMGAVEFEFVRVHGLCPHKRKRGEKSISKKHLIQHFATASRQSAATLSCRTLVGGVLPKRRYTRKVLKEH